MIERQQQEIKWLAGELQRMAVKVKAYDAMREALREIAEHPHCDYDHPANDSNDYGTGCADGHRCAATMARNALEAIQKGSCESANKAPTQLVGCEDRDGVLYVHSVDSRCPECEDE